ncbi:hypothetical protein BDV59DRAFT_166566 [Aspergillus ambiguus]|uniref:uncharacterized protein n=1 Tax=Aspergillus ambiguus TaxID=176160 RepID=UPI003CCCB624
MRNSEESSPTSTRSRWVFRTHESWYCPRGPGVINRHICNWHQKHRGALGAPAPWRFFPLGRVVAKIVRAAWLAWHFSAIRSIPGFPPSGEGNGIIRFRLFWLGWRFLFFFSGQLVLFVFFFF